MYPHCKSSVNEVRAGIKQRAGTLLQDRKAPMNLTAAAYRTVSEIATEDDYIVQFSDVTVNLDRSTVVRGSKKIALTSSEFELLTFFLQNPDKPLTRDMILDSVWCYLPSPNTRTVDAHVLRLRQKLEAEPESPRHFVTVHRVGYRFSF
jgi:DNA-binding response OmpR family regulator